MGKTDTRAAIERRRPEWSAEFRRLNPGLVAGLPQTANVSAPSAAPKPKNAPTPPKSPLAVKFEELWAKHNGPELEPEFRFCKDRKFRFDYVILKPKVAIELEGGIHKRVGHASPKGYIKDCRKYNLGASMGWVIFRLASGMMTDEDVAAIAATARRLFLETEDFSC